MNEKVGRVIEKAKEHKLSLSMAVSGGLAPLATMAPVHAEGAAGNVDSTMTTAMSTAFDGVKADVLSIVTTALPPALAIMGIIIAITVGIRFFKRSAK